MIEKLAKKIVVWQVNRNYLSKADESLYTYAYELLIGQVVNILIACLLAIIFHAYTTVFIYLITYIPLRSFAGGHHADTNNACTVISSILILIVCIMAGLFPPAYIFPANVLFAIISGFLLFLLAPVQDHNKPLDPPERIRYKKCSRLIWTAETALWVICYKAGAINASFAVTMGHITLAVLLCLGTIKNKYLRSKA